MDSGEDNSQDVEDWYDDQMFTDMKSKSFVHTTIEYKLPTMCHFCIVRANDYYVPVIGYVYNSSGIAYGVCREHEDCLTLDGQDFARVLTAIFGP